MNCAINVRGAQIFSVESSDPVMYKIKQIR